MPPDTSSTHPKVIVLELNELCPTILERMMAQGALPNFKALHARADVYITHAHESEDLEPWVQWVTLHTGQLQSIHGAKELDEGYRITLPRIWDKLGNLGLSSLVFGSMNSHKCSDNVFMVPDPWSTRVPPSDPAYAAFHRLISFFVTEHTNARAKPTPRMAADFIRYMLRTGLSFSTALAAARQILSEQLAKPKRDLKWRRALILDWLMWDVFVHEYRHQQPHFATFFANSTAFLQHRYWRHMEPEAYQVKPSACEMASYSNAITDSYRHMDKIVGRAMQLVGPGGRIVLATALSQEANLRYESIGGKFVYRPYNFAELNRWAGGPAQASFEPVMTHQCWASLPNETEATAFEAALENMQANGESVMEWRRDGSRVFFWCKFISQIDETLQLTHPQTGATIRFLDLFAFLGQVNNSQHSRDGAFWVERADGLGKIHPQKLPLEQAGTHLLNIFSANASADTKDLPAQKGKAA